MGSEKLGGSKPENGDTVQLNIRNFPEQLRTEFKILCLRRGTTMTEEIIRLVRLEVERESKK